MLSLLIGIIIICLLIAFEYWIMTLLPIPQPFKNIIIALLAVLTVAIYFGGGGYGYVHGHWLR